MAKAEMVFLENRQLLPDSPLIPNILSLPAILSSTSTSGPTTVAAGTTTSTTPTTPTVLPNTSPSLHVVGPTTLSAKTEGTTNATPLDGRTTMISNTPDSSSFYPSQSTGVTVLMKTVLVTDSDGGIRSTTVQETETLVFVGGGPSGSVAKGRVTTTFVDTEPSSVIQSETPRRAGAVNGALIAGVVGAIVALVLVLITIILCRRRRQRSRRSVPFEGPWLEKMKHANTDPQLNRPPPTATRSSSGSYLTATTSTYPYSPRSNSLGSIQTVEMFPAPRVLSVRTTSLIVSQLERKSSIDEDYEAELVSLDSFSTLFPHPPPRSGRLVDLQTQYSAPSTTTPSSASRSSLYSRDDTFDDTKSRSSEMRGQSLINVYQESLVDDDPFRSPVPSSIFSIDRGSPISGIVAWERD
ncbi:hypothetical protein L218DRAFT_1005990 [Marasmius fiardii PR-910]|nr:hypothetical protein L218DRAFT_1005990 [Marasmius fiardii PR-910]